MTGLSPRQVSRETWLSHLPPNQVLRFKDIFEIYKRPNNSSFPQVLSLTNKGVIERDISNNEGQLAESYDNYQVVEKGDFVLNPMDLLSGWVARSSFEGVISNAYFVFRLRSGSTAIRSNPVFYEHLLQSYYTNGILEPFGKGVGRPENGGGRWTLNSETLGTVPFPHFSLAQQDETVEFLDRELEEIDALIAKNEALVTNLLERRKALISSFVTFGSASSKAVPNNWIPQRLRHLATIESGRDYKEVEVFDGGYPIYGSGGEFGRASRYLYSGESVLLGRKGTIDRPLYVNEAFWTVDTMYWTRFKLGVCIKFMYYWATTIPFKMYSTNTALPSMTGADLKNMPINLPPLDEQIAIATELDQAIQGMDILQKNSEKSVQLLRERRQALIASAVTGKLELQGAS